MFPVPWPGIEPIPTTLEAQNLNHWKSLWFLLCIFRCGFLFLAGPQVVLLDDYSVNGAIVECTCEGRAQGLLAPSQPHPLKTLHFKQWPTEARKQKLHWQFFCVCEEWKLMWVIQFQEKTQQKGHKNWANVLSVLVFDLNISPIFKFLSFFISFNVVFRYIDLKCLHFYVKNFIWNNDF